MAAPYNPPVKNEDFVIYVNLSSVIVSEDFQVNPTIAEGDFKVKLDTAAPANITVTPSIDNAGETAVRVSITAAQFNADVVTIIAIDQTSPKEWADWSISIPTTSA